MQLKLASGEGEIKGKGNSCFSVNSLPLFFTVATGEIRRIRFPQEEYVFHTWENQWKKMKSFSSDFPRTPLNFTRIPQIYNSLSCIMWNPHLQRYTNMHKIGLMLRDNVHLWSCIENCIVNWGIIGKSGEIRGKLGENWGILFPQWGNTIPWQGNQLPPHRGKRGEMRENCSTKIPI